MIVNHWKIGQLPYNSKHRINFAGDWSHSDNIVNYTKNPNKDVWKDVEISYAYNAQGFRCPDLESFRGQKVNIALGCSFTEGIGLPLECAWPSLLGKNLEYPVVNLGVAGATTDTVARILTNISVLFYIQNVFIMWPTATRFESYHSVDNSESYVTYIQAGTAGIEHAWALEKEMGDQRYYKNQLIVNLLSTSYGYRVKQLTTLEISDHVRYNNGLQNTDLARDGSHWGYKTHELIAKMFVPD